MSLVGKGQKRGEVIRDENGLDSHGIGSRCHLYLILIWTDLVEYEYKTNVSDTNFFSGIYWI